MTAATPNRILSDYYTAALEGRGTPSEQKSGVITNVAARRVSCYPDLTLALPEHEQLHSVRFIPVGNNGHPNAGTYLNINVYHRILSGPNAGEKDCIDSRVSLRAMGSEPCTVNHLIANLRSMSDDLIAGNTTRANEPFAISFKPSSSRNKIELHRMELHRVFGAERGVLIKLICTGSEKQAFSRTTRPATTAALNGAIWVPLAQNQTPDSEPTDMTLGQLIKVLIEMRKAMVATWRHRNNEQWLPDYDGVSSLALPLVREPRFGASGGDGQVIRRKRFKKKGKDAAREGEQVRVSLNAEDTESDLLDLSQQHDIMIQQTRADHPRTVALIGTRANVRAAILAGWGSTTVEAMELAGEL